MKSTVSYAKNVTITDIVKESLDIWKKVLPHKPTQLTLDQSEDLLKKIRSEHDDFAKSYPIVLRYMCQLGMYHPKAMERWITKIKTKPWGSEDEFIECQADYVVILYKVLNPRCNSEQLSAVRTDVTKTLKKEHKYVKDLVEQIDKNITEKEDQLREKNVKELQEFLNVVGVDGMKLSGTIRVETDLPMVDNNDINLDIVPDKMEGLSSYDLLM
jgi:hypothetical protein